MYVRAATCFLATVLGSCILGCGSPDEPAMMENNGVKPVPNYEALIKAEVARMEAQGAPSEESDEEADASGSETTASE